MATRHLSQFAFEATVVLAFVLFFLAVAALTPAGAATTGGCTIQTPAGLVVIVFAVLLAGAVVTVLALLSDNLLNKENDR